MEVRKFRPQDLCAIHLQPNQKIAPEGIEPLDFGSQLSVFSETFTATHDGEVIACVGLIPFSGHCRRVWAYLSADSGRVMLLLHRNILRWLRYHGAGRIEATIACDFLAAIRWAEMLGFEREGPMKQFERGRDYFLYARVRT